MENIKLEDDLLFIHMNMRVLKLHIQARAKKILVTHVLPLKGVAVRK